LLNSQSTNPSSQL